jgi:hypothetical protein
MMRFRQPLTVLLLVLCVQASLSAMTIRDFLGGSVQDEAYRIQLAHLDSLDSGIANTPWIRELQFRTQTDEWTLDRQRFSIRLRPRGFGETGAEEDYLGAVRRHQRLLARKLLHDALKLRYSLVLDYLYRSEMIRLKEQLRAVHVDRVRIIQQSLGNLKLDPDDLIKAESDKQDTQLDLIDLRIRLEGTVERIQSLYGTNAEPVFDRSLLPGPDLIEKYASRPFLPLPADNLHRRLAEAKRDIAATELELEKAKDRDYISHIDAGYRLDKREEFKAAFSIELAFRWPWITTARTRIAGRAQSLKREEMAFQETGPRLEKNISREERAIRRFLGQYRELLGVSTEETVRPFIERFIQLDSGNPLILLRLRETTIKRAITLEQVRNNLYLRYLELLDTTGDLSAEPRINWFAAVREVLP